LLFLRGSGYFFRSHEPRAGGESTKSKARTVVMPELLQRNLPFLSVAASVLAVVFYLTYSSSVLSVSFDIDEADYMYSMEKGFAAHYFDRNALSFLYFVKTGFTKGL
jgi:hypothetical protein